NDKVVFVVGGEAMSMKPGEMWEINNLREHFVDNGSEENRIHLIMDWAPLDITRRIAAVSGPEKQPSTP
ncbi:MAG: aspartyl/asparaginyl beta-hydroxylase domain-containing protein, partial [Alphaproteobacteria bacterium]